MGHPLSRVINMSFEREVKKRAEEKCEFCGHNEHLEMYVVPKTPEYLEGADTAVWACTTCVSQFDDEENRDANQCGFHVSAQLEMDGLDKKILGDGTWDSC